jgi:predicted phosphodiesterase
LSAKTIRESVKEIGIDETAKKFNLARESVRRENRRAKNAETPTEPIDNDKAKLLERVSAQFSTADLRAMLNEPFKPSSRATKYDFSGDKILFGVASDWHVGSAYTDDDRISALAEFYKKEGASLLLIPGDLTEGMSGRDGHVYELKHIGYKAQKAAAIRALEQFCFLDVKLISGNHDLWYAAKANMGALIVEDICAELSHCEYLGEHEGSIYLNGARADLWHGEDGSAYALSYRIQKIVESLEGGSKPQMIFAGHDHKAEYIPNLRNIQAVESGCVQRQTPWMRRKKLAAHEGAWLIEATIKDKEVRRFKAEWIPFYK